MIFQQCKRVLENHFFLNRFHDFSIFSVSSLNSCCLVFGVLLTTFQATCFYAFCFVQRKTGFQMPEGLRVHFANCKYLSCTLVPNLRTRLRRSQQISTGFSTNHRIRWDSFSMTLRKKNKGVTFVTLFNSNVEKSTNSKRLKFCG